MRVFDEDVRSGGGEQLFDVDDDAGFQMTFALALARNVPPP